MGHKKLSALAFRKVIPHEDAPPLPPEAWVPEDPGAAPESFAGRGPEPIPGAGPGSAPLRITWHGLTRSDWVDDLVRTHAIRLLRYHPWVLGCHVIVDRPHRHHERGSHVEIRLEIELPGSDVSVSHLPSLRSSRKTGRDGEVTKSEEAGAERRHIETSIRSTFATARRILQDRAQVRRHEIKTHAGDRKRRSLA